MSSTPNPNFSNTRPDLGTAVDYGIGIDDVDVQLQRTYYNMAPKCIICGNTADLRIIPKHKHLLTAEIQNRGFIDTNCLQQGYLDTANYGIRKLQ